MGMTRQTAMQSLKPRTRAALWRTLTLVAALSLLGFYLAQNWTLAPNNTDDGFILGYIHQMANGAKPHHDLIDAYGLFNWVFPVTFYKLAGQKVWGIRVWLVLLKIISVLLTYKLVSRLGGLLYGLLAAFWLTILLGQAWQSLQTAYAFLSVVPLVLAAWYVLVCAPFRKPSHNANMAAVLTTLAIWTKLNTGMFLLAGGLFTYLFWPMHAASGASAADPRRTHESAFSAWLWALSKRATSDWPGIQVAAVTAYAGLFYLFMHRYFNVMYFVYLLFPLLLVLGFTLHVARKSAVEENELRARFNAWGLLLTTTLVLSGLILFLYYGVRGSKQYVRELSGILSNIHYTNPFPPLGEPSLYVGFTENFWPQVPWLLTALFCVWLLTQKKAGKRTFGSDWPAKRAQVCALFLLAVLHSFVIYARSDETHIFQALLLVVPVLFVIIAQLEAFLSSWRPKLRAPARIVIWLAGVAYAATLAVRPTLDAFDLTRGDYANPHLQYLRYRRYDSPYVRDFADEITDRDWDRLSDDAARYVDSVTDDNEEVLLLTAERLIHYNGNTRPVGGRYGFHFYLVSVGLLDRAGWEKIVPPSVIRSILSKPPRVIVSSMGNVPLIDDFVEFRALRNLRYVKTRQFRHIEVYELKTRWHKGSG